MSLLDRSNKTDTTALSQYIVDKYVRMISTSHFGLVNVEFDTDKLYIYGDNDFCGSALSTRILQDMYDDIKKDFTIISDSSVNICVDSDINILEHVKIKCDDYCDISYTKAPNMGRKIKPQIELKNLDIDADSLVIDLPGVKLSNVNIYAKNEIAYTSVQGVELFKSISGNITAKRLDLRIYKSPLTESLYTEDSFDAYKIYDQVINTNFINLLEPDKFNIDTYYISNWEFFNFYITKIHNTRRDYRHIRDDWYFA